MAIPNIPWINAMVVAHAIKTAAAIAPPKARRGRTRHLQLQVGPSGQAPTTPKRVWDDDQSLSGNLGTPERVGRKPRR